VLIHELLIPNGSVSTAIAGKVSRYIREIPCGRGWCNGLLIPLLEVFSAQPVASKMTTHQTAKTQYVSGEKGTFAYRRFGAGDGTPLLFLIHFRGTMDKWDPLLINGIAGSRPVILVDYLGLGQSKGPVATTFQESAADIAEFLSLMKVTKVDVLGFSIGAFVAQLLALNTHKDDLAVKHLIICGSSSSVGPDMPETKNDYATAATQGTLTVDGFKTLFFPRDAEGEGAADAWWARVQERNEAASGEKPSDWGSQDLHDQGAAMQAQGQAYAAFLNPETSKDAAGSYDRLGQLDMPVLVAQGSVSGFNNTVVRIANNLSGRLHVSDAQQLHIPAESALRPIDRISEQWPWLLVSVC
jgi:pimeloyl-ACP methyl ester carboxylesterase